MHIDLKKEDLESFLDFYHHLKSTENIVYMYFATGLLHYAFESCTLVPNDVNLVLITSCLSRDEIELIEKIICRPHINFENYYHDGDIWDLIASQSEENFGWLDVDCFIFNKNLFKEMMAFKEGVGINTLWVKSYTCYCIDDLFSNTYFQFFQIDALRTVRQKYDSLTMLPVVFNIKEEDIVYERYRYLTDKQLGEICERYPMIRNDKKGLDTTHYYQILMFSVGYSINRVRKMNQLENYYSNDALHLGGCHMLHRVILDRTLKRIYYRFNMRYSFYLLNKNISILPKQYQILFNDFTNNLQSNSLSANLDDIVSSIWEYAKRNNIEDTVRKIL